MSMHELVAVNGLLLACDSLLPAVANAQVWLQAQGMAPQWTGGLWASLCMSWSWSAVPIGHCLRCILAAGTGHGAPVDWWSLGIFHACSGHGQLPPLSPA